MPGRLDQPNAAHKGKAGRWRRAARPGQNGQAALTPASTEQRAKEPGAATARSASAARRTAQQRAAKGRPAQSVAAGASALAHKLDRQTVRQGAQLAEAR